MKHEKAPTTPRFEGVLTISYMPMFWKIKAFGHFWPSPVGRKFPNAHPHINTFHLNLFTCLFDHPLQKKQSREAHVSKIRCFWTFSVVENYQKAHLHAKTFHMSLFPGLYDHILQRNSLEKNQWRTDGRTPRIYKPQTFGVGA